MAREAKLLFAVITTLLFTCIRIRIYTNLDLT